MKPHEVDAHYSLVRIQAMLVPDGKISRDQFHQILEERRRNERKKPRT